MWASRARFANRNEGGRERERGEGTTVDFAKKLRGKSCYARPSNTPRNADKIEAQIGLFPRWGEGAEKRAYKGEKGRKTRETDGERTTVKGVATQACPPGESLRKSLGATLLERNAVCASRAGSSRGLAEIGHRAVSGNGLFFRVDLSLVMLTLDRLFVILFFPFLAFCFFFVRVTS